METPQAFEATSSLSYPERLRAAWALTLSSPASLVWLGLFPILGTVLLVIAMLPTSRNPVLTVLTAIACFAFVPLLFLFNTYSAHRADRKHAPYTYRFDETGLQVISANSDLKQTWAAIPRIREHSGILLLYFSERCAHCVPLRALGGSAAAISVIQLASASRVRSVCT